MQRREIAIAFGGVLIAAGGAAMFQVAPALWPQHEGAIFVIAAALVAVGIGIFIWSLIRRREQPIHSGASEPRSTTARALRGGQVHLEDSFSSADIFADAEDNARITATRVIHDPARRVPDTNANAGEMDDGDALRGKQPRDN